MKIYDTIVIGGGPSGISCVHHLKEHKIDYLLIEHKVMLNSWRHERWDSFYLVTPNWMTNLPGVDHLIPYDNAYMSKKEIEHVLLEYLNHVDPNYVENTVISHIHKKDDIYEIYTNNETYYAQSIIIAVGLFNQAFIPEVSKNINPSINQIHSKDYMNPSQLKEGGTLVVGAGRSGVQIALEIKQTLKKEVYLSIGSMTPLPTIYKNLNGVYWLNRLSGYKQGKDLLPYKQTDAEDDNILNKLNQNLFTCQQEGIHLLGRLEDANHEQLVFSKNLQEVLSQGDRYKMKIEEKVNDLIDQEAIDTTTHEVVFDLKPIDRDNLKTINQLNQKTGDITNIIWCTGYKPNYDWLTLDIFDEEGRLDLIDDVKTKEKVYFCGMALQPDPQTRSSFGVGLFALVESAERAVKCMINDKR